MRPPADPARPRQPLAPGDTAAPFSAMAMYPALELRTAWDQLYGAAARSVTAAPADLRWDLDVHATWLDPRLVLGMTCGWPLVTQLQRRVRVVGTFQYVLDGEVSHTYRSVIIAREGSTFADLLGSSAPHPVGAGERSITAPATFAFNSVDSLSGYVSMMSLLPDDASGWPGPVLETGAHLASIDDVRSGAADVASIDALTWAYVVRAEPERVEGLAIIGRGPVVPHLPLIVGAETPDEVVEEWRIAFATAVRDPALSTVLHTLLIEGFVALEAADYERALDPLRRDRST